ncbi:DUF4112 domain-containing protein [halophilic archaeon]|nr:DUF4112 domain-containing protein [halophilic archaeon]
MTENRDLESAFDDFDGELPDSVDEAAVERMRAVATILDESVRIPGTEFKIGVDPLLGAIPVAGDVISAGLSLYIVVESARLGVTFTTLLRMLANVAIDVAGGSVPYVGELFDAVWKANVRNFELAMEELTKPPERRGSDDFESQDVVEIDVE